ncbi:MAG: glycosyltransferase family 4 protein [Paraprevotella sp.]|nr:glycosyltransferase family 4 protein [Paraprevotella sp.]
MIVNKRVMMVGSAEQSGGGVASVIRTMKRMPFWKKYSCDWLGTQIQSGYGVKLWYALKAYVKALLTIWRYDIIHFHTVPDKICLVIQMPVLLLALLERKKIIMHIHMGNQLEEHTNNKLFIWCLKRSDLIVLLAKKWQRRFGYLFPTVNVPTTVIYNACETIANIDFSKKEKSIIMAAYLDENKRPDLLLQAWSRLSGDYPDWHVTIMGNGDVEGYSRMAHEMGLDDCVTFTGYITGERKADIWDKASIYCMCSRHEGFPMVVLEAWANGIAVVTTPVGGLPDVIEEGKNCLTFNFDDADELTVQLCRLIEDSQLRRQMGEYANRKTTPQFALKKINSQIEEIYKTL